MIPDCVDCGGSGACVCTDSDNLSQGGVWIHPLCLAKRGIFIGENLQFVGSPGRRGLSPQKRYSVPALRLARGNVRKPISQCLRAVQGKPTRLL